MKLQIIVAFFLTFITNICVGQSKCGPTSYFGKVSLNTIDGKGIDGVLITINNIGSERTNNGNFRYTLTDCPGTRIRVESVKDGYSVVNHHELAGHVVEKKPSRRDLQFHIIMCLDKDVNTYRIQYYDKLGNLSIERKMAYMQGKIDELEKDRNREAKRSSTTAEEMRALNDSINSYKLIVNNYRHQKEQTQEVSKVLASTTKLDTISQQAFNLYKQGSLSAEDLIMEIVKQEQRTDYSRQKTAEAIFNQMEVEGAKVGSEIMAKLGSENWSTGLMVPLKRLSSSPNQVKSRELVRLRGFNLSHRFNPNISMQMTYKGVVMNDEFIIYIYEDPNKKKEVLRQFITDKINWDVFRSAYKMECLLIIHDRLMINR